MLFAGKLLRYLLSEIYPWFGGRMGNIWAVEVDCYAN